MHQYRFDFLDPDGVVFATHEVAYGCDKEAIQAGRSINGFPTIGAGYRIWREDHLVYAHLNILPRSAVRTERTLP